MTGGHYVAVETSPYKGGGKVHVRRQAFCFTSATWLDSSAW